MTRGRTLLVAGSGLALALSLAIWSYRTGGLVHVLWVDPAGDATRLDGVRAYVESWGPIAPLVYLLAVTVEVMVAPIPGAMLYAPGGAIFGGLIGGTLALAGNVLGAAIACWIARTFGEAWLARRVDGTALGRLRDRLRDRGGWVVFILRLNPLTSSDLVSYAAGLAGVPPRQTALGTLFGMAPQCYAQAYLAESLFTWMPFSPAIVLAIGAAIAVVLVVMVLRKR